MKYKLSTFLLAVAIVQLLAGGTAPSKAAAQVSGGLTVAPAQLSFIVKPEAPTQTAKVVITNAYTTAVRLTAELRAIDETGARLVPTGTVDEVLAKTIKLSATDITVPARGSYTLTVVATDTTQLSDGGHYASLVLTERGTTAGSTLQSAVAVSIFVIKDQNIRRNLELTAIQTNRSLFSLPHSVRLSFKNSGNTHVIPRASVGVYEGQTLIAKGVANSASQLLLPNQQADFTVSIERYRRVFLPRKLALQVTYRIDGTDVQLYQKQTFWYIPLINILVLLLLLIVLWRAYGWLRGRTVRRGHRRHPKKETENEYPTPQSVMKRKLGRTVIRTHQAASGPREQSVVHVSPADAMPAVSQKRIVVAVVDDSAPPEPQPKKPRTKVVPKTKASLTRPRKTGKTATTSAARSKTASAKAVNKSAKPAAKQTSKKRKK